MSSTVKNIEEKAILFIEKNKLLNEREKVVLAFSGGPDSVFALHFLNKFKPKYKIDLCAFHVNHSLRNTESDEDEKFCRRLCGKLGIEFSSVKVDVKKYASEHNKSIEEAARILRYGELEKYAYKVNADKIVTAHNMNDNAETVLLNFFKGTGVWGLAGIPVRRGRLIRPFLSISKEEILDYLKKVNLNFRTDTTNFETDFERNFLRLQVVPLIKSKINPSLEKAIFRNSEILRNTESLITRFVQELTGKFVEYGKEEIRVDLDIIEEYGPESLAEICRKIFPEKLNIDFNFNDLEKINSLIRNQTGKQIYIGENFIGMKDRNKLIFKKKEIVKKSLYGKVKVGSSLEIDGKKIKISETERSKISFDEHGNKEYISGDNISDEFIVRKWETGDRFIPLGMKNFKKISDFLTEIKVPATQKENQLVLVNNNNIVWVIGHRIDERYKILPNTKRILELWLN